MLTNSERTVDRTRVVAVCLDEADWRAFVAVEPEPVAWLRQQIRDRISRRHQPPAVRRDPSMPSVG